MPAPADAELVAASETGTSNRATRSRDHSDRAGWLAVAAVLLWPAVEAIRIVAQPVHQILFGDYALFELSSRQAWHLDQLLGPNAHAGFNHPGPAMFYLLAPAVRLLDPSPGLYLGAVLINLSALAATVVVIWHSAGSRVALWAAAVLSLLCLAVGLDTLRQPWNPLLIIVPMVLFVVLWARSVTGTAGAWLWAAVVGSYEIQTHLTTAIFVTAMLAFAGLWALAWTWRRASPRLPRGWWRRPARLIAVGALALIWLPATVELFHNHPNNWNKTWHWVHHGHNPGIAVGTAAGIVLRSVVASPFNHATSDLRGSLSWWSVPLPASQTKVAAAVLVVVAGGLLIGWLVHRRERFAAGLACASILAVPLATVSVSHSGGDNYAFLTGWLAFVPYVLLLAFGMGLLAPRPLPDGTAKPLPATQPFGVRFGVRRRPFGLNVTAMLALAAVACSIVAVVSDLRERSVASVSQAAARATPFVRDAEAQLKPGDRWVGFVIASPDDWGVAAGVVVELERLGYGTVVDPRFDYLFGARRTVMHPVQVLFSFYLSDDPAGARVALGPAVSAAGGTVMTAWRPGG